MKHLILLHGALGHTRHFAPLLPFLEQHFTIHQLLFDGHGNTPIPAAGIRMQHYIDQLHRYVMQHDLEEFDVFGYSMGGYVSLCYALQHPGLISSQLTLATKLHWTAEGATRESQMLQPDVITEKVPRYAAQLAALHGEEQWKHLLPAIAGMMTDLGNQALLNTGNYAKISTRTQLMVGDKDNMVSLAETHEAAALIPDARLAVLPGTKHPLEQVRVPLLKGLMCDFWSIG